MSTTLQAAPPTLVPPQNIEAEEAVLGAMLLSENAIGAVTEILDASHFYRGSHGTIYRACLGLWGKGEPVDAITLANELEERGELETIGGTARVAELAALVSATANVEHYARIVKETATLRGLINAGQEIARLGRERMGETAELVDRAEQIIFDLAQQRISGDFAPHRPAPHRELRADHEALRGRRGRHRHPVRLPRPRPAHVGVPAGQPRDPRGAPVDGEVGARALHRGEPRRPHLDTPVALFTLEMSKAEVTQRLMCSEAKVESDRVRSGKLTQEDWPRLTAACDKLMKAPIYVDDTGSITMMELRSKARRLKSARARRSG